MVNYIINDNTLALIGINPKCTKILENSNEFIVNESVISIINNSCLNYGSSYQGRWDASKFYLNREYKLPIIIRSNDYIIFMPLKSVFRSDCIWICFNRIVNYYEKVGKINVDFYNYGVYEFDISIKSFESLISKSCILQKNIKIRENFD